jgi:hypothetical protein
MAKKKYKVGDVIPLTKNQKDQLTKFFDEAKAHYRTIESLSVLAHQSELSGWALIKDWFPATAGFTLRFTKGREVVSLKIESLKKSDTDNS